jgi:hypothetical protein
MPATKKNTPTKAPKKARAPRKINGITVPDAAVTWRLQRLKGPRNYESPEICAMHDRASNRRLDEFPLDKFPPDWGAVLRVWGSGSYRFAWYGPGTNGKNRPQGFSLPETFDDPAHPARPVYSAPKPGDVAPAPPAAPAGPKPDAPPSAMAALMASAKDGKVEVATVGLLMTMMSAQVTAQQQQYQAWLDQERQRRLDQDAEWEQRARRAKQWADEERAAAASFWASQAKLAAETREAPASKSDAALEAIRDELEGLREEMDGKQGPPDEAFIERMVDKYIAPVLAARMMPPSPPITNG